VSLSGAKLNIGLLAALQQRDGIRGQLARVVETLDRCATALGHGVRIDVLWLAMPAALAAPQQAVERRQAAVPVDADMVDPALRGGPGQQVGVRVRIELDDAPWHAREQVLQRAQQQDAAGRQAVELFIESRLQHDDHAAAEQQHAGGEQVFAKPQFIDQGFTASGELLHDFYVEAALRVVIADGRTLAALPAAAFQRGVALHGRGHGLGRADDDQPFSARLGLQPAQVPAHVLDQLARPHGPVVVEAAGQADIHRQRMGHALHWPAGQLTQVAESGVVAQQVQLAGIAWQRGQQTADVQAGRQQ
jgi:hypothetical protein